MSTCYGIASDFVTVNHSPFSFYHTQFDSIKEQLVSHLCMILGSVCALSRCVLCCNAISVLNKFHILLLESTSLHFNHSQILEWSLGIPELSNWKISITWQKIFLEAAFWDNNQESDWQWNAVTRSSTSSSLSSGKLRPKSNGFSSQLVDPCSMWLFL